MVDKIEIEGYKSIRKMSLELKPINLLIGSNGSGKSNFLSFFELLGHLHAQRLSAYVAQGRGPESFLFQGSKVTEEISAHLSFNEGVNGYSFDLLPAEDQLLVTRELLWFHDNSWDEQTYGSEARVKYNRTGRANYINEFLESIRKYHFHDTGQNSPFTKRSHRDNDQHFLYEDGDNLAAFLLGMQGNFPKAYHRLIKVIQSIAPFFNDFYLRPNPLGYLTLQWQDRFTERVYGVNDLSDGTIRFIALATLFLQPDLPGSIIIDEPELGLHPTAISKLAGMVKSVASRGTQVIMATQSADLIGHFSPEDVVTVDQRNGESKFERLQADDLGHWLESYTLGDLWQRNIIEGGQPY